MTSDAIQEVDRTNLFTRRVEQEACSKKKLGSHHGVPNFFGKQPDRSLMDVLKNYVIVVNGGTINCCCCLFTYFLVFINFLRNMKVNSGEDKTVFDSLKY